jgi:hypothetical protein
VDGKYLGPAANFRMARSYALAEGEHEVRIEAGKTTKLSETMKPLAPAQPPFGRLRTITTEKYAAVYVNDKFMGHAGEFNNPVQGLLLNPGEYTVKIVPVAGGPGHEEKVKIEADKTVIIRVG